MNNTSKCIICYQDYSIDYTLENKCQCKICSDCIYEWLIFKNNSNFISDKLYLDCPNEKCSKVFSFGNLPEKIKIKLNEIINRKRFNPPIIHNSLIYNLKIEISELRLSLFYKPCPHCGIVISKIDGCRHIKCVCNNEFCYDCLLDWKNHSIKLCNKKSDLVLLFSFIFVFSLISKSFVEFYYFREMLFFFMNLIRVETISFIFIFCVYVSFHIWTKILDLNYSQNENNSDKKYTTLFKSFFAKRQNILYTLFLLLFYYLIFLWLIYENVCDFIFAIVFNICISLIFYLHKFKLIKI